SKQTLTEWILQELNPAQDNAQPEDYQAAPEPCRARLTKRPTLGRSQPPGDQSGRRPGVVGRQRWIRPAGVSGSCSAKSEYRTDATQVGNHAPQLSLDSAVPPSAGTALVTRPLG